MSTRAERDAIDTRPIPTPSEFVSIVAHAKPTDDISHLISLAKMMRESSRIYREREAQR